jgi:F-type H+-transporting ATPase subunit b
MDKINLTFIGQMIFFALFVWICMKTFWPFLLKMMKEREEKIAKGLEAADRASKDLDLAQKRAAEQLKEAKLQAAEIVEQANKRANQIVEEAKQKAIEEGNRQLAAKEAEIEQMVNRAKEDLRKKVSSLAMIGAEKILKASIDQKVHGKLVDDLAAQL